MTLQMLTSVISSKNGIKGKMHGKFPNHNGWIMDRITNEGRPQWNKLSSPRALTKPSPISLVLLRHMPWKSCFATYMNSAVFTRVCSGGHHHGSQHFWLPWYVYITVPSANPWLIHTGLISVEQDWGFFNVNSLDAFNSLSSPES